MPYDDDIIVVNEDVPAVIVAAGDGVIAGPKGDKGDTGARGLAGYSVLNGTSNPTSAIGQNGDFYINTSASTIFGPKSAGVWGSGKSLIGPVGPQGPNGPTGPVGPQGSVTFAGTGSATTAARSDHTHVSEVSTAPTSQWRVSGGYGGTSAPSGAALFHQMGTFSTTTGNGGIMNIPFPMSFPNGLISVVATIGAQTNDAATLTIAGSATNTGVLTVVVRNSQNVPLAGGLSVRVNYFATGW